MNAAPPAGSALATPASTAGPTTPKKGPPKFKQRQTRTFKSKAPKPGQKGSPQCHESYSVMIFLVWRVLAQISLWCAHGRRSETWSSAIWPNMALSKTRLLNITTFSPTPPIQWTHPFCSMLSCAYDV
ncbi:uncharacterized protein LOC109095158 isoform X2 [Cyprinus carpio]|uniref:3',5'-cyclic-GMP phosphodiesterase n=2 Tax=Cyprinus carpio TaxID=7962 RepID=A0A8C1H2R7_CYPCA|nr:uncharacterized protein LOC109095158 isoform X2 [Cyprinus carpio]